MPGRPHFVTFTYPFDALNEGDPVELSGSYLAWKNQNGWDTIW